MKWIYKKLLRNFGTLDGGNIQRSGQPGRIKLWLHYRLFPFKSVINLAWAPGYDKDDSREEAFCRKRGIGYLPFSFGAGGPEPLEPIAELVIGCIEKSPKPVWIHCEGGKDRTGGIITAWMIKHDYKWEEIFEQAKMHKVPAEGWIIWALKKSRLCQE